MRQRPHCPRRAQALPATSRPSRPRASRFQSGNVLRKFVDLLFQLAVDGIGVAFELAVKSREAFASLSPMFGGLSPVFGAVTLEALEASGCFRTIRGQVLGNCGNRIQHVSQGRLGHRRKSTGPRRSDARKRASVGLPFVERSRLAPCRRTSPAPGGIRPAESKENTMKSQTLTKKAAQPVSARLHKPAVGDAWMEGYLQGYREGRQRGFSDGLATARLAERVREKNAPTT